MSYYQQQHRSSGGRVMRMVRLLASVPVLTALLCLGAVAPVLGQNSVLSATVDGKLVTFSEAAGDFFWSGPAGSYPGLEVSAYHGQSGDADYAHILLDIFSGALAAGRSYPRQSGESVRIVYSNSTTEYTTWLFNPDASGHEVVLSAFDDFSFSCAGTFNFPSVSGPVLPIAINGAFAIGDGCQSPGCRECGLLTAPRIAKYRPDVLGSFMTDAVFEGAAPCCEYRQWVRSYDWYFGWIPSLPTPGKWAWGGWREDVDESTRREGGLVSLSRFGHREDLPNLPSDSYSPDRPSGPVFHATDKPRPEASGIAGSYRSGENFYWEFGARVQHTPNAIAGCSRSDLEEVTIGGVPLRWTVCLISNDGSTLADCGSTPLGGGAQAIAASAPPTDAFLGETDVPGSNYQAAPYPYEELLSALFAFHGDTLAVVVGGRDGMAGLSQAQLQARALGVAVTVEGLTPTSLPGISSAQTIVADSLNKKWERVFVFRMPQRLASVRVHITGIGSEVVFNHVLQGTADVEPTPTHRSAWLITPQGNPAQGATTFLCEVPRAGICKAFVFDAAGRRVSTIVNAWLPAGLHELRWDARAEGGQTLHAGVYLVRLEGAGGAASTKVAIVR